MEVRMNKKVSIKEIVGNKIVYSIIIASYYWMWARSDWKNWYDELQVALGVFLIVFFIFQSMRIQKYKKEGIDEMAEQNLKRCDSICLKSFVIMMIAVAGICAIFSHTNAISMSVIGWFIILSIVLIAIIRTVIFVLMDNKGI